MTHPRTFALVLLLAPALLVACSIGQPKAPDAKALLGAAAAKVEQPGSFHFDLTQQNGTTPITGGIAMVSASGDIATKDRMRMNVKGKAGTLNLDVSFVVLPGAAYMTNPLTGKWDRTTVDVSALFDPSTGLPALMRAVTEPRVAGTETVGGTQTYRIEAKIDSGQMALFAPGAEAGHAVTARAWIGVADQRVYRIEVAGPASASEAPNMQRRLELSRFGEDFRIEAPALQ